MLEPGDRVPRPGSGSHRARTPVELAEALAGDGAALLCFYPFDWSPTCTNELLLLRDRLPDLSPAGVRPFAISRDSPWSHAAWATTMGVDGVPLLSDWNGEATRGFGVAFELARDGRTSLRAARS